MIHFILIGMNEVYLILEVKPNDKNESTLLNNKGELITNKNWITDIWDKYRNFEVITKEPYISIKYWN